jgi:uncharacterized protein with HEPN domain
MPDARERDLTKCEDMRLSAERALRFLGSHTQAEFLADELLQAAVIRCVEVIGEAARLVSAGTRERAPEIPWTLIIGMRNILVHDYGAVDLGKVYDVVHEHVPRLLRQLAILIPALERDAGWTDDEGSGGTRQNGETRGSGPCNGTVS